MQLAPSTRKPKPLPEKNNSTRHQERNNSTRHQERNNSTLQEKTTRLCTAVDRLHRFYSGIGFFYLLTYIQRLLWIAKPGRKSKKSKKKIYALKSKKKNYALKNEKKK
ncbi:hypothetical protein TNCV_3313451 [Trichonephila clavipes]|nr:hypothetical protein TNCV_3313451 [Trichonephila clavipes]